MRVIVLDPNQRIAATFDTRALPAAAEAMDATAASVRADGGADLVVRTPMAPVLVLPRVFELDFCTQLIRLWGKGDHKDSGVSSRYGNVNVSHLKQTEDYTVVEPMMQKAISDRLAYRIGPELTKVFAFDRQFAFDSMSCCPTASRESTSSAPSRQRRPHHADRAFAVSLNLNDDFEGGELVFPNMPASSSVRRPAPLRCSPARCCIAPCR